MFKRWITLIVILLSLSAIAALYFSYQYTDTKTISNTCLAYLDTVDADWNADDDLWYAANCDLSNLNSIAFSQMRKRQLMDLCTTISAGVSVFAVLLLLISFVARWVISGQWKW